MIHRRTQALRAAIPLLLCGIIPPTLHAQPAPPLSRTIIVLDPAHGGDDTGARISDSLSEKDLTLAFAARLRPLAAAGFTVAATRDADPSPGNTLDPDQRAGIANHPRALACIFIHATPSGSGVHIYTSALSANSESLDSNQVLPWDSAQSAYIPLSVRLANQLGAALLQVNIPALLGHASIRPLDNLTCPAVAIELAPLAVPDSDPTPVTDATYQQHIAQAIVTALISWRNNVAPPPTQPAAPTPKSSPQPAAKPATKPTTEPPSAPAASPQPPAKPASTPAAAPGASQ